MEDDTDITMTDTDLDTASPESANDSPLDELDQEIAAKSNTNA